MKPRLVVDNSNVCDELAICERIYAFVAMLPGENANRVRVMMLAEIARLRASATDR